MELQVLYVKHKAPAAHIWDYLKNRSDYALCGHPYANPVQLPEEDGRPNRVCRACEALAPKAEAKAWQEIAEELNEFSTEYENLWTEYEGLWTDYEKLWREYEYYFNANEFRWSGGTKGERTDDSSKTKKWKPSGKINPRRRPPRGRPRVKLRG